MDSDTGSDKNSDKINSVTLDTDSDKAKLKTSDSGTSSDTRKPLTSAYFYFNYSITNMSFIYIIYKNIRPYKNKKGRTRNSVKSVRGTLKKQSTGFRLVRPWNSETDRLPNILINMIYKLCYIIRAMLRLTRKIFLVPDSGWIDSGSTFSSSLSRVLSNEVHIMEG